jgi:hypothetical protein
LFFFVQFVPRGRKKPFQFLNLLVPSSRNVGWKGK